MGTEVALLFSLKELASSLQVIEGVLGAGGVVYREDTGS